MTKFFVGIDIQIRRACCYAVVDSADTLIASGWFSGAEVDAVDLLKRWPTSGRVHVGIDAPRMPLVSKRQWYWRRSARQWTPRKAQTCPSDLCIRIMQSP